MEGDPAMWVPGDDDMGPVEGGKQAIERNRSEQAVEKLAARGAMNLATSNSFRLNPHSAAMLAMPNRKTFSALPVEKPPPMNEAESVAKTIHAG